MINNTMEIDFYFFGIMTVIQEILKLNSKEVNKINIIEILKKLNLEEYTEAVLDTYFNKNENRTRIS